MAKDYGAGFGLVISLLQEKQAEYNRLLNHLGTGTAQITTEDVVSLPAGLVEKLEAKRLAMENKLALLCQVLGILIPEKPRAEDTKLMGTQLTPTGISLSEYPEFPAEAAKG